MPNISIVADFCKKMVKSQLVMLPLYMYYYEMNVKAMKPTILLEFGMRPKKMLYWSNMKFSNRVGRADFFKIIASLYYKHIHMERCQRVKETTLTHLFVSRFIFTVCNRYSSSQIFMEKNQSQISWQLSKDENVYIVNL